MSLRITSRDSMTSSVTSETREESTLRSAEQRLFPSSERTMLVQWVEIDSAVVLQAMAVASTLAATVVATAEEAAMVTRAATDNKEEVTEVTRVAMEEILAATEATLEATEVLPK